MNDDNASQGFGTEHLAGLIVISALAALIGIRVLFRGGLAS